MKSPLNYWKDAAVAIYISLEFGRKLLSNIHPQALPTDYLDYYSSELAANEQTSVGRRSCVSQPSSCTDNAT